MNKPIVCISPIEFQNVVRHVAFNMNEAVFCSIFGGNLGDCYQWKKFAEEYRKDAAKWICYLDGANVTLLWEHCEEYLAVNRRKGMRA
jgi:hypothetical protein